MDMDVLFDEPLEVLMRNMSPLMTTDMDTPKPPAGLPSSSDLDHNLTWSAANGAVSALRDITEDDVLRWAEEVG